MGMRSRTRFVVGLEPKGSRPSGSTLRLAGTVAQSLADTLGGGETFYDEGSDILPLQLRRVLLGTLFLHRALIPRTCLGPCTVPGCMSPLMTFTTFVLKASVGQDNVCPVWTRGWCLEVDEIARPYLEFTPNLRRRCTVGRL